MSENVLRVTDLVTSGGQIIKHVVLNAPQSLNALSDAMGRQLGANMTQWDRDDNIVAIWLEGAGSKAFCAGGDSCAAVSLHDRGWRLPAGR